MWAVERTNENHKKECEAQQGSKQKFKDVFYYDHLDMGIQSKEYNSYNKRIQYLQYNYILLLYCIKEKVTEDRFMDYKILGEFVRTKTKSYK